MIFAILTLELLERRVVGCVAEQVIAPLVVKHRANPAGDVVCVVNEQTARLLRQVIQSVLGLKVFRVPLLHPLADGMD